MILLKDKDFVRGNCPMTKEDIRALDMCKMNLTDDSIVLDIGAGTGSITVQTSKLVPKGRVYSIEKDEENFAVCERNIEKFDCDNVILIKGEAIDIIDNLKNAPTIFDSIFIGGSGGNLEEIIAKSTSILSKDGVIVMNFVTIENVYKAIEVIKKYDFEVDISLVNISKNKDGSYMMIANNPIYVVQCMRRE